jgi:hypothetical protein
MCIRYNNKNEITRRHTFRVPRNELEKLRQERIDVMHV